MPTLEVISDVRQFRALQDEWNVLAERFKTPLLRHEWFVACLDAFGADDKLTVFTVWENGRLCAAAPFVVERHAPVATMSLLGQEVTEPGAFIYADEATLNFVASAVLRHGFPLLIPRLRTNGPELQALRRQTGVAGFWLERSGNTATATVPLACDFATFESRMAGDERRNIRRRCKLAERDGPLSFEILAPSDGDFHRLLREVYEVESSGWKRRAGTAILCDPRVERFCTDIATWAAKADILRLAFMRIGGKAVAGGLLLNYAGRLWGLKQGYDERWAPCAPSILLAQESIRYACGQGLAAYEFLGSAEKFQTRWPIAITPYSRLRFYPLSLRGLATLCADACRMPLNQLRAKWRSKSGSLARIIRPAGRGKIKESLSDCRNP